MKVVTNAEAVSEVIDSVIGLLGDISRNDYKNSKYQYLKDSPYYQAVLERITQMAGGQDRVLAELPILKVVK